MSAASCNYGNGWKTFGVERVRSCWRQGKLRVDTSFSFSSPSSPHQLKSCRFILIFPNNSLHHLSRGFYQKVSQPRPRRRRRRRLAMERLGGETGETLYEAEDSTQSERAESLDTHTHTGGRVPVALRFVGARTIASSCIKKAAAAEAAEAEWELGSGPLYSSSPHRKTIDGTPLLPLLAVNGRQRRERKKSGELADVDHERFPPSVGRREQGLPSRRTKPTRSCCCCCRKNTASAAMCGS